MPHKTQRSESSLRAWARTSLLGVLVAGLIAGSARAGAPSFSAAGVMNAASYAGGAVASGEIVTIQGTELGPAKPVNMQLAPDGQHIMTSLGGTRVLFDGVYAPLIYVSASQVNAVVPLALAAKTSTQVRIEYLGVMSAPVTVPVAKARPGVFTLDSTGQGQGAALNWPEYTVNGPAHPVSRGSAVMVFATAGGWNSPPAEDGKIADGILPLPIPVAATIGDAPATVLYAGAAPTLVTGVLQVNIQVPDCAPSGDRVPLTISIDGARSQLSVTIAVRSAATGGVVGLCSPYVPKANVYRGQLHDHTTNSDGRQDPASVVRAYRDSGYHFISVTDHGRITADPGVPGILFIPGVEESHQNRHFNRINVRAAVSGGLQSMIDRTLAEGGLVFVNHPNATSIGWTDADLEATSGFHGIESRGAEDRVDFLLSRERRFFLFATDDCHDVSSSGCMVYSTEVSADSLDSGEILRNLKGGNFYASSGAAISAVKVSGQTVTITTDQPGTVEFIAAGGRVVQRTARTLTASYTAVGDETYLRVRVTRDSDKRMAWTNPIYVER